MAVTSATDPRPERGHPSGRPPLWRRDDGSPIACVEKIKVLNENYAELCQMAQDAIEDGLLMGCSEAQMREALHALIDGLVNPYVAGK
ncbi:MAG: hypothetical protein C0522_10980 [Rhodocyclaceae bacterium]|jgi:hypothetical protein|nr:hypothetical protein [Rhodocyclaceae bacterium]